MEHDHIGHHHRPTWPHANSRSHTQTRDSSDSNEELRKRTMLELAPTESSTKATGCPSSLPQGQLHRSSDFTAAPRSTRESISKPVTSEQSPSRDSSYARRIIVAKLPAAPRASRLRPSHPPDPKSRPTPGRCLQRGERRRGASIVRSRGSAVSHRSPGLGAESSPRRCFQESERHLRVSPSPVPTKARTRISPGKSPPPAARASRPRPATKPSATAAETAAATPPRRCQAPDGSRSDQNKATAPPSSHHESCRRRSPHHPPAPSLPKQPKEPTTNASMSGGGGRRPGILLLRARRTHHHVAV